MALEYEETTEGGDEFKQGAGGWWIRVIAIVVFMVIIVAYAAQTLQLVQWLFADGNWFMQIVTMFVCDGCATGYAMAEMFYRFRLRRSKHVVFGMWIVTFTLSTLATVIQMYLSSTHNIPHSIDPQIIALAYGLVILAFVVNIIAITVIFRMEHGASQPQRRYLDDGPRGRKGLPRQTVHPVPVAASVVPSTDKVTALPRNAVMKQWQAILDAADVPGDHAEEFLEGLRAKGVEVPEEVIARYRDPEPERKKA